MELFGSGSLVKIGYFLFYIMLFEGIVVFENFFRFLVINGLYF